MIRFVTRKSDFDLQTEFWRHPVVFPSYQPRPRDIR